MAELNDWQWAIGAAVLIASLVLGGWLNRKRLTEDEGNNLQVADDPATANQAPTTNDPSELSQLRQQLEARDSELSQLHQQLEARDSELSQLHQQLEARDSELKDAREEAELTLMQLHQVQEEHEQKTAQSQLSSIPQPDPAVIAKLEADLKDAREEAELTLLQLHQVQEELEHYFLESRVLQQKLDAVQTITPEQQAQLKRINARLLELFKTLPASANRSAQSPRLAALVQRQQNALRRFERLHAASFDA